MYELVDCIVGSLIDKSKYDLVVTNDGNKTDIRILCDADCVSEIIGRGGKIANAIRVIVRNASRRSDTSYGIHVEER